jgi:quinoprotein glucose dehydrogenase
MVKLLYLAIFFIVLFGRSSRDVEWSEYLGGADRNHYSSLDQINKDNVHRLKKIWEFHTADTSGQMQCNPIMADGLLYGTTASIEVFALDPSTGKEVWRFQDASNRKWYSTNRGVSFWKGCAHTVYCRKLVICA